MALINERIKTEVNFKEEKKKRKNTKPIELEMKTTS